MRRGRRSLIIAVVSSVAALALAGAGASAVLAISSAERDFAAAVADLREADDEADTASESLRTMTDAAAEPAATAELIVSAAADDLVDAGARAELADAAGASASAIAEADALLGADIEPGIPEKPDWPWELSGAEKQLEAAAQRQLDEAADLRAVQEKARDADAALSAAATALYASVPATAAALEAANVSAGVFAVLDFRDAAAEAAGQDSVDAEAVTAFAAYAALAENLERSAQSELEEKSGPLYATRLEIEAYARSIAGGVVLDFDWAPLVNGLGGERGLSGTATWNTARGGFSTITLSDSIAETWPDADAMALVTHEVGHSITSKCSDLFDSQSSSANEEWATAWAISMGHTAEGNGVQAYGYPSQGMIDAAAGCR